MPNGCRDHHRHDGQTVEAVGEIHRIAGADDHEGAERNEEPAEIEQQILEERERQRGRERRSPAVRMMKYRDAAITNSIASRALPEKPACATAWSP
jgi:hypothetical protein